MIFLISFSVLFLIYSSVNAMSVEIEDFKLNLSVVRITESSEYIYVRDNETLYYNNRMSNPQSISFYIDVKYNGTSNISHVNTTTSWWGESPRGSSKPYQLTFDIESSDTQTGSMIISVWTKDGHTTNVTVFVILDNASPANIANISSDIALVYFPLNSTTSESTSTTTTTSTTRLENTTSNDHRMTSNGTKNIKPSDSFSFNPMTPLSALITFLLSFYVPLLVLLKYEKSKKQRKRPFVDIFELLMEMKREFD